MPFKNRTVKAEPIVTDVLLYRLILTSCSIARSNQRAFYPRRPAEVQAFNIQVE